VIHYFKKESCGTKLELGTNNCKHYADNYLLLLCTNSRIVYSDSTFGI